MGDWENGPFLATGSPRPRSSQEELRPGKRLTRRNAIEEASHKKNSYETWAKPVQKSMSKKDILTWQKKNCY